MSKRPLISVRDLRKVYGKKDSRFEALKGLNLDIQSGESVAIIGKSGSGKSTFMHLLALLDRPTEGEIRLKGTETSKLKARQLNRLRNKQFGFVFQSFFMNSNDTVLANVMLPLKIAGVKPKERKRRALKALETVGLADKAKNKANDLSGGQKQRVCIARAIVNRPKIIFADEPTGNLDSHTGSIIQDLLFGLNENKGITLIIVTHDEDLAAKCHRQIRIADGEIVSDSKFEELPEYDAEEEEYDEDDDGEDIDAWEKEDNSKYWVDTNADGIREHSTMRSIKVRKEDKD